VPAPPSPSPHRHRLYTAALDQAADLGPNEGARWLIGHGLLALTDHPLLPAPLRPPLVVATQRNTAANLLRVARFQEIAEALGDLPFCPLKGIHLIDTVYRDDPEHRPLADLDLLVREEDAEEALGRLAGLGYREGTASRRNAAERHERELSDGRLTVELHTRLGIKHGPHSTWTDLAPRPGTVHGRACHLLDAETTVVHLITHFVKHGPFTRLVWVEDVLRCCERGVDGAAAFAVARRLGAARSFVAGVRALAALAGDDLLEDVPRSPSAGADRLLELHESWVWRHLQPHPLHAGFASNALRRNSSALLLADRPADAVRFLRAKARELAGRLRHRGR
jgi:hypothetical protein